VNGVSAIARLTWMRLARGRMVWAVAALIVVPILVAAFTTVRARDLGERWPIVAETTLRSLVLLAPILLLAGAIAEESEGKTYTYLWSRPIRRQAVVAGKLLAIVPALIATSALALAAAFAVVALGPGAVEPVSLLRVVGGAALGVVAASASAVGIGAVFPRHPLVVALGWIFFAEQVLPSVKAVQNLSALYHVRAIADLPDSSGDAASALVALAVLTAFWLAVAWWRVGALELGSAEG
jgi:ABC-type transport system involved in multi-copper enzyme maturation permease subunit